MTPHKLCVAPMMERTDRHCRYLMRSIAPNAWVYTEMITAPALLHGDSERFLRFDPREHPVALQLGGSDPGQLAAAARLGEAAGYDEVNLNVGCPSPRVKAGRFGVVLMLEPELVASCVEAMRRAVCVPVTVKCRIGVDDRDDYAFLYEFTRHVVDAGCTALFVHARKAWLKGLSPKQNREVPPLDYSRVHRLIADFPGLEVVINGGLDTARTALRELGFVDGIMLGRSAYAEPMLMAELDRRIFAAGVPRSRADIAESYVAHVESELASGTPLRVMTRHLMGLYAHQPGARRWRRELGELAEGKPGFRAFKRLLAAQRGGSAAPYAKFAFDLVCERD
ncbi:tRNA dihydrouridine(20/20a) synthase DusA [Candidatus Rariloculus sp.]|uniref:tRNA dihydrouridine(20/20a) synthase DusA n=1 Tax=Candidatus Rariloculus sp. TaxID=3101265 RepID=UPI003D122149